MKVTKIFSVLAIAVAMFTTIVATTSCSSETDESKEVNSKEVAKVTQTVNYRFNANVLKSYDMTMVYTDQAGQEQKIALNEQTMQKTDDMYQFKKEFTFTGVPQKVKFHVTVTPKAGATADGIDMSGYCTYTLATYNAKGLSIITKNLIYKGAVAINNNNFQRFIDALNKDYVIGEHNFTIDTKNGTITDNK
jgi:hypothetical protein